MKLIAPVSIMDLVSVYPCSSPPRFIYVTVGKPRHFNSGAPSSAHTHVTTTTTISRWERTFSEAPRPPTPPSSTLRLFRTTFCDTDPSHEERWWLGSRTRVLTGWLSLESCRDASGWSARRAATLSKSAYLFTRTCGNGWCVMRQNSSETGSSNACAR